MAKASLPISTDYPGLSAAFRRVSENLCQHSLPVEVWNPWHHLTLQNGEIFPAAGATQEKLPFVDHYLFEQLLPKNTAPNSRMKPRWRADLNKYRGWLLHRTFLSMLPTKSQPSNDIESHGFTTATPVSPYRLPEDFPKLVDDLYLFHKHIRLEDANIDRLKSFSALDKLIAPYRPLYPLLPDDRALAHARYLETETAEDLRNVLPEDWQVTRSLWPFSSAQKIIMSSGKAIPREGGAKLIAALGDGTEIIQLLTEQASLAYGSPRWCTAYRQQPTYFEDYKDNLIVVIAADGQRWQLHNRRKQYMDASDNPINLASFIVQRSPFEFVDKSEKAKWHSTMAPFLMPALEPALLGISSDCEQLFGVAAKLPELRVIVGKEIQVWLQNAIADDHIPRIEILLKAASLTPEWSNQITEEAQQVQTRISRIGIPLMRENLERKINPLIARLTL